MSELLVFDAEPLQGPIAAEDLTVLRNIAYRWQNLAYPLVPGRRAFAPVMDQLVETVTWKVTGRFDADGDPHADQEQGVEENLEHYRALFTGPGDPVTGLHDIELQYAGVVLDGQCQVANYGQTRTGPYSAVILTLLVITAGELETGS